MKMEMEMEMGDNGRGSKEGGDVEYMDGWFGENRERGCLIYPGTWVYRVSYRDHGASGNSLREDEQAAKMYLIFSMRSSSAE